MAPLDLLERIGLTEPSGDIDDDDLPEIPDDAADLDDDLPEDPRPSRKRPRFSMPTGGDGKATPAEKRQVKDALSLIIKGPAGLWSMRDPHCGGALAQQADAIIKSLVPIICRNPAMLRWFTGTNAPWLDILGLLTAFGPFVGAVWAHHVTHTVGGEVTVDAPDFSAYGAPHLG